MADLIEIAIKRCGACRRSYSLTDWSELELVETVDKVETRTCLCGQDHELDLEAVAGLVLFVDRDVYAQLHPTSSRPVFSPSVDPEPPSSRSAWRPYALAALAAAVAYTAAYVAHGVF